MCYLIVSLLTQLLLIQQMRENILWHGQSDEEVGIPSSWWRSCCSAKCSDPCPEGKLGIRNGCPFVVANWTRFSSFQTSSLAVASSSLQATFSDQYAAGGCPSAPERRRVRLPPTRRGRQSSLLLHCKFPVFVYFSNSYKTQRNPFLNAWE